MNPARTSRRLVTTIAVVAGGLLAACGSSSGSSASDTTAAGSKGTPLIEVISPWARTSAAMQDAGAAYMTIENTGTADDALTGASVAATVAGKVELHETVADTAMGSGSTAAAASATTMGGAATSMAGAMKMQPVAKITVPAKGEAELKPGGYHVMLLQLATPLVKGSTFDLTLTFESGTSKVVKVEVRDQA
jgi:hypothetical protein